MSGDDQFLKQYTEAVRRRDEVLSVLLDPDTALDDRRDAAVTYSLLTEVAEEMERRAGFVRVSIEQLRKMNDCVGEVVAAVAGSETRDWGDSPYHYIDADLVIAPRGAEPRVLTERVWAEFFDGVALELRAWIEDAS